MACALDIRVVTWINVTRSGARLCITGALCPAGSPCNGALCPTGSPCTGALCPAGSPFLGAVCVVCNRCSKRHIVDYGINEMIALLPI